MKTQRESRRRAHRRLHAAVIAAAAIVLVVAGGANASTTFDPDTGKGLTGKGDLQTPWGWSNKTLQDQASEVTFRYRDHQIWEITCSRSWTEEEWDGFSWETQTKILGNGKVVENKVKSMVTVTKTATDTKSRIQNIHHDITGVTRVSKQVTGFLMQGPATTVTAGELNCPSGWSLEDDVQISSHEVLTARHPWGLSVAVWMLDTTYVPASDPVVVG